MPKENQEAELRDRLVESVRAMVDAIIEDARARHGEAAESPESPETPEAENTPDRVARVNALIEELIDSLGVRGSGEGVVIAIGPEGEGGPPPSPQELAAAMGDDGEPGECPHHKATSLVAAALEKVGTSAGASRGWDTKNQVQPPKPATEELETPGADRPPDVVPEVDTAAKAISSQEASERAKRGWETRRKKGKGVLSRLMSKVPGLGERKKPKEPSYGPGSSLELRPRPWRAHAEDEAEPGEVEASMKALAENAVALAAEVELLKHKGGRGLNMTADELAAYVKKAWASRKSDRGRGEAEKADDPKGSSDVKKAKKSMEPVGALAGLVYPAWARPGSGVAARYDDRAAPTD